MEFPNSLPLQTRKYLKLQGLWLKALCDNSVTHTINHIQCNLRTMRMHNMNNITKLVKGSYAIFPIKLISK
jgi:hypothetical protein